MTNSTKIDEGDYAFPGASVGMSLRDWFAGKALTGVLSSRESQLQLGKDAISEGKDPPVYIAEAVYEMADAMIAARKGAK